VSSKSPDIFWWSAPRGEVCASNGADSCFVSVVFRVAGAPGCRKRGWRHPPARRRLFAIGAFDTRKSYQCIINKRWSQNPPRNPHKNQKSPQEWRIHRLQCRHRKRGAQCARQGPGHPFSFLPSALRARRDRPVKALWPDRSCAGYAQV
jgi:hypothetical protein